MKAFFFAAASPALPSASSRAPASRRAPVCSAAASPSVTPHVQRRDVLRFASLLLPAALAASPAFALIPDDDDLE